MCLRPAANSFSNIVEQFAFSEIVFPQCSVENIRELELQAATAITCVDLVFRTLLWRMTEISERRSFQLPGGQACHYKYPELIAIGRRFLREIQ